MIKKKRTGLIVWGSILLTLGAIFLIGCIVNRTSSYGYRGNDSITYLFPGVICFIGGGLLLGFGIRNSILVSRNNSQAEEENRGVIYYATCFSCGTPVEATFNMFQPHRNYPEGFVYCSVCKRPISKNMFFANTDDPSQNGGITVQNQPLVCRANCLFCGTFFQADPRSFRRHKRYPEGFVYCPLCKKPNSRNAFRLEPLFLNNAQNGYPYNAQNGYPGGYTPNP